MRNYICRLVRGWMLIEFLFMVNVDEADESTDAILNKCGEEPRFVVSSRERKARRRYQCGLSLMTSGSK